MTGFRELARAAAEATSARPDVPLALATLVQVDGSSYRQPGARLLVDAEGRVLAGAISGGCLEGDVAARAAEVCATGRGVRLMYDLRADLEAIWGFGAACDGIAHLLLEPLPDPRWLADVEAIRSRRGSGAVLTVLDGHGGGSSCAVLDGDAASGTWRPIGNQVHWISGPELMECTRAAQRTGHPLLHDVRDDAAALFIEPLVAPIALHVIGAGRGADAFVQIARALEWEVTVIDHRPAVLAELSLPPDVATHVARYGASLNDSESLNGVLATLPHDGRTAVALLSHIFDVDSAWLTALLPLPVAYIGVLGSRKRAGQLLDAVEVALGANGTALTDRMRHRLHAPIGLDLGGESPASIALSAIAEIEAVIHGRPAGFLRERQSPIHARTPTPRVFEHEGPIVPTECDVGIDDHRERD
ncbi:XdhC family protein [Gemmatimonas groenlandica]|uniref:XdhC family protein n=1 Tax=Gemmatimonas groenlandica TaxID=2732249 RepID=A0A6M4IUW9_9BACT|nr:XdhC family protein [Gemmatimonas groenlandica]QJR37559.1 XdhC family protein [Gemmatimonas groenlandica]